MECDKRFNREYHNKKDKTRTRQLLNFKYKNSRSLAVYYQMHTKGNCKLSLEMITEIDCSPNYFCTSNEKGTIQWIFFYFDFPSKAVTIFWTAGKGRRTSFLTYHCQFLLTKIYIPSEQKGLYSSLSNMLPNYDLETSTKSCSHTTTTVPKPTLLNSDS